MRIVIATDKSEALHLLQLHNESSTPTNCTCIDAVVSHLNIADGRDYEEQDRVGTNPLGLSVVAWAIERKMPFVLYSHESWADDRPRGIISLFNTLGIGERLEFANPDAERNQRDIRDVFFRIFEKLRKKPTKTVEELLGAVVPIR